MALPVQKAKVDDSPKQGDVEGPYARINEKAVSSWRIGANRTRNSLVLNPSDGRVRLRNEASDDTRGQLQQRTQAE